IDSLVYASFSPHRDTARVAEFMRDVAATKGARSDRFTALAYDAFTLVARAIGKAGSTRSSAVRKALLEANAFDGTTGKTRWTPGGSPIKQPFIHRVEKDGAGSKFVLLRTETDL
ncbi:MAG: ABC transporter substrate-binding protein, partial [Rhodospirillales bacterium]|nr:ABC transporter substrate-binding protein [Rhodospirillales bacterium]